MIDTEKTQKSLEIIQDSIAHIQLAANQDRKINNSKQIDGHYRKALEQLDARKKIVLEHLSRSVVLAK